MMAFLIERSKNPFVREAEYVYMDKIYGIGKAIK
jgi:hypothetical protein